eukprot:1141970-Pelagomonas_calceolata.AAC.11
MSHPCPSSSNVSVHPSSIIDRRPAATAFANSPCLLRPQIRFQLRAALPCAHLQLGGQQLEDVVDLVLEPTRQHLIGLIQHKHLDEVRAQAAAAQHVIHAARGAHHHVHTSTQDAGVLAHTGTTHAGVALNLLLRGCV